MSFGPIAHVERQVVTEGAVPSVTLAPYTFDELAPSFPWRHDDPALAFLGPSALLFLDPTPESYMAEYAHAPEVVAWGVWSSDRLVGLAEVYQDNDNRCELTYGVALMEGNRGRGIGGLVTAGIIEIARTPHVLSGILDDLPDEGASGLYTAIHESNLASERMCKAAGYMWVGRHEHRTVSRRDIFNDFYLPLDTSLPDAHLTAEEMRESKQQRDHSLARYVVTQAALCV